MKSMEVVLETLSHVQVMAKEDLGVWDQLAIDEEKTSEDDTPIDTWEENELNQRIKNGPLENW